MRPPLFFWVFNSPPPALPGADGPHRGRGHVGGHCPYINNIWCGSVHALLRYRSKCKNSPLTPIVTKISFASFSARRGPPTPKLSRSRSWCLLYPEPKFHADRTILRWDILNRTNKKTNKKSKLNITPNATIWRDNNKKTLKEHHIKEECEAYGWSTALLYSIFNWHVIHSLLRH